MLIKHAVLTAIFYVPFVAVLQLAVRVAARLGGIIGIRIFSPGAFLLFGGLWFAAFCLAWRLIRTQIGQPF
jgi:hypothetical protein